MSSGKKRQESEGWESLAEEASGGTLASNPELEEALREAAESVDEAGQVRATDRAPSEGSPGDDPDADGTKGVRAELADTQERLIRLRADFDNFRKRALRERQEALQYGHENLVKDLLTTVDNLERAIEHARRSEGGDLESLLQGVELVQRELLGILAKHGVTEIEAAGRTFDPALHEAMAQLPDATADPNTVVDVLQKGYQLRDRLVRPARVVVARSPEGAEDAKDESGEGEGGE